MKCVFPEISWHNRDPVLSLDIHPETSGFYRLATSGADCHVLIWQVEVRENGAVNVECVSDLTRHQRAVNVVRWSPCGLYLASGDDDANVIIWQRKTDNVPLLEGDSGDKEIWIVLKVLRGHKEDVYDLCWSPNSSKLITGSIDNTAIIWDLAKGKSECILTDHKGFVQGVCWDPKDDFLATISSDRVLRIFTQNGKHVKARVHKGLLPVPENHSLHKKEVKFFHDDTFKSYFRRLQFSPDGNLIAVPSGCVELEESKPLNAVYIFTLDSFDSPAAMYPTGKQSAIAVRFSPNLFELHPDGPNPVIDLPYRMIFAVATDSDIIIYDTQQPAPFTYVQKIHYTRLTDISWTSDSLLLSACSTDGYCTFVTFEPEELGLEYVKEESEVEESSVMDVSGCEELPKENDMSDADVKVKRPSFLEQWAIKTPKKAVKGTSDINSDNKKNDCKEEGKNVSDAKICVQKEDSKIEKINVLQPKRITPLKVGSDNKDSKQVKTTNTPKLGKKTKDCTNKSPLLSFLKTSTPVKKPKIGSDKGVETIVIDEVALDAFPKESESKINTSSLSNNCVSIDLTEDEDFKLEYSNLTGSENETCTTVVNEKEEQKEEKEASIIRETEPYVAIKAKTCKEIENSLHKNSEEVKVKKRVPLITLSSPKNKKNKQ